MSGDLAEAIAELGEAESGIYIALELLEGKPDFAYLVRELRTAREAIVLAISDLEATDD